MVTTNEIAGWPHDLTGDRLVSARVCAGLSRGELAELAGITVETIGVIEGYGAGPARASRETKTGIVAALRSRGIEMGKRGQFLVLPERPPA